MKPYQRHRSVVKLKAKAATGDRHWTDTAREWLSAIGSLGSLAVAIVTLVVACQSTETREAVSKLSTLATETKRQADLSSQQLDLLRSQASDSKSQTEAISRQTQAIVGSSIATTRAADAQRVVSIDTANMARPRFVLAQFEVRDMTQDVSKVTHVRIPWAFQFKNAGTMPATVHRTRAYVNFGNQRYTSKEPPATILGNDQVYTGGSVMGVTWSPLSAFPDKATFLAFRGMQIYMNFYGEIDFTELAGVSRTQCFAFRIEYDPAIDKSYAKPGDTTGLKCQ